MSLKTHGLAAIVLTTATLFGNATSAQAHTYEHIDRLALQLQRETEEMHREVHAHFRGTPDYVHLDRDVAQMERLARHIHDVAHHHGSVRHLREDVEQLDRSFHHIEEIVARLARTRQIGFRTMSHFREVMGEINDTLHHLRDDLAHMRDVHYDHHHHHHDHHIDHIRVGPFRIRW